MTSNNRKRRGSHAVLHQKQAHRRSKVMEKRQQEAFAQRLSQCACCGANVYDAENKLRPDVRWRQVSGWKVQLCDRHEAVECRPTPDGRARFFEVPKG